MQKQHNTPSCILCGNQRYKPLFAIDTYTLHKCMSCGLVQTHPLPDEEKLDELYDEEYFVKLSHRKSQEIVYHTRLLDLIEQYKTSGNMLEVGIGVGFFLELAHQKGWDIQGVDPSEVACRYVSQIVQVPIYHGALETMNFRPKTFDVIVLRHVLEHVAEPKAFLQELHHILKDDGLICLVVPNFGGVHARLEKEKWFHLAVPHHVAHYTKRPLQTLIWQSGFDIIRFMTTDLSCSSYFLVFVNIFRKFLNLEPVNPYINPREVNPKESLHMWLISKETLLNNLAASIGFGEELTLLLKKGAT